MCGRTNVGVASMKIKTASNGIVVALMAALSAYLFATAFQIHALEDILSPVNAILASGVLLFAYLRSTSRSINRISFLLNAIACFAWGAADTAWAIIAAGGQDPSQNPVLWVIYALTNVSLAFSFFIALVIQFSKWNKVQFMADALTIVALSGIMLWIGFFHKDSNGFTELLQMDFTSLLSIMLDILISVGVFQWFISVRSGHMPRYMLILAGSAALFALTDIAYYYFEFWQISVPSELTDFLYIASLAGLALGGVWKLRAQKAGQSDQPITNIGSRSRWVLLLIIPVFTLILDVTRFAKASITLMDYLFFAALIFLHWVFSRYIQISLENERLLAIEKLNNATLEKRVADQVRELTILANQDALTALRNRRFFISELEDRIHSALQEESLVVVVLDIDRFKMINDNYGPEVGDAVLMEFAGRLRGWQRENVTVARLGGDEFGLLFTEVYTNQQLEDICGALITLFHQPITLRGKTMQATVSLGVAARTANIDDGRLLLQNAEIALHQAKSQGYNRYQIFDPLYSRDIINANKIELLLRQADIETEFELFYQPQFSLPDRSLIGAEALIRWKNAEHGYISPACLFLWRSVPVISAKSGCGCCARPFGKPQRGTAHPPLRCGSASISPPCSWTMRPSSIPSRRFYMWRRSTPPGWISN